MDSSQPTQSSRDALLYNAKMSAAEIAEAAKAAGNAAFKAGNFDEAIAEFTKAVEADPTNHVLYSNRSGAHAAKADFKAALLDANKCIDLKADWAKGHSRRGAAYFGLKNGYSRRRRTRRASSSTRSRR